MAASLIDHFLPEHQTASSHALRVRASPAATWSAVRNLDFGGSTLARALYRLRGLPPGATSLATLQRMGFVLLGEREGEELLLGLVGRPWKAGGDIVRVPAEGWREWRQPGYAKVVWAFTVAPEARGSVLGTETRIHCTDPASRRRFAAYWLFVGPFSGLLRRAVLGQVRRAAER